MKKNISILFFLLSFTCFVFSESLNNFENNKGNLFGFSCSVGTASIIYGKDDVPSMDSSLSRFVVETDLSLGARLDEKVRFNLGSVILCDLNIYEGNHSNLIDYGFYAGMKIYPGLAGLALGMDYMLGRRTDFVELGNENDGISSTAWGNGFRFLLEYDFLAGRNGVAPILGFSWRRMPRTSSTDNILSIFFRLSYF